MLSEEAQSQRNAITQRASMGQVLSRSQTAEMLKLKRQIEEASSMTQTSSSDQSNSLDEQLIVKNQETSPENPRKLMKQKTSVFGSIIIPKSTLNNLSGPSMTHLQNIVKRTLSRTSMSNFNGSTKANSTRIDPSTVLSTFQNNIEDIKDLTTDEKIKRFYQAKQSINNHEEYARQIKNKEREALCQDLGVDYELENEKYGYFVEMALQAKLPSGWSKELQQNGKIYYFNRKDGSYGYSHPCLNSFKFLMQNEYKKVSRGFGNNRAVFKIEGQVASSDVYTNRTHNFFYGTILKDITLFKLSKYFTKGKQDKVFKHEKVAEELKSIYENAYGYDIKLMIPKLKSMMPMQFVEIQDVKKAIFTLKLFKEEPWLVWIARLYSTLPLPDNWERIENEDGDQEHMDNYQNWFSKITISVRPCYSYIIKLIEKARENRELSQKIARIWMVQNQHVFQDGFGRIQSVENHVLFRDEFTKKLMTISEGLQMMFKADKQTIVKKDHVEQLSDPFVEKVEKYLKNPDLQDIHILTICKQLKIDPDNIESAHLLFFIYNFIQKRSVLSNWHFRNPENGECYWINHEAKRISGEYPFLDELQNELKEHVSKLEFKTHNNKLKNLVMFKKLLKTETDQQTISEIARIRTDYVKLYTMVKDEYNFELYQYLRSKLDLKIENFEKHKKFVLEEDTAADIKNRPKLRNFIAQPFDVSKLSSKLIKNLTQNDIKDLLFYNFFDLNKFTKAYKSDSNNPLQLGNKDVLVRFDEKMKKAKMRMNADRLADQIMEDIQDMRLEYYDSDVDRMVGDAQKLLTLATKLKEDGGLEEILNSEIVNNQYLGDMLIQDIRDEKDSMNLRINFYSRYDEAAKLKEQILQQKWDQVKEAMLEKETQLKLERKNKKRLEKLEKGTGKKRTRYKKESKRQKNKGLNRSFTSNNSQAQSRFEQDQMTDLGGEHFLTNEFDSDDDMPLNMFQKIKNPKAKKNFRKAVSKSKIILGFATSERDKKSSNKSLISKVNDSRRALQKLEGSDVPARKNSLLLRGSSFLSQAQKSNTLAERLKGKSNTTKQMFTVFLNAFRGYLKQEQSQGKVLQNIQIPGPMDPKKFETLNYVKQGSNTSFTSLYITQGKEQPDQKLKAYQQNKKNLGSFLGSNRTLLDSNEDFELSVARMIPSENSVSIQSSVSSNLKDMSTLGDDLNLLGYDKKEHEQVLKNFKEKVVRDFGSDLVSTISSNINQNFMKLLKNKRNFIPSNLQKSRLLEKLIITSLKGQFKDMSQFLRKKLKQEIKKETFILSRKEETSENGGDLLAILLKRFETNKTKEEKIIESLLVANSMKSKLYEFGSGTTKLVVKNKLIAALNEFSNFYEEMIATDIMKKQTSGDFDYLSLINLLRQFLTRVMTQFSGWSQKDQTTLDLILERAEKAFFSSKLKKKFISNKQTYLTMNVFDRLNNMETFSLKRLFQTIKGFLIRYQGQVSEKVVKEGSEEIVIELRMPKPLPVDNFAELPWDILKDCGYTDEEIDMFGTRVKKPLETSNIYKRATSVQNPDQRVDFALSAQKKLEYMSRIEQNSSPVEKIEKLEQKEQILMRRNFQYENVDKILEKVVSRALFELVDFKQIKQIHSMYVNQESTNLFKNINEVQSMKTQNNTTLQDRKSPRSVVYNLNQQLSRIKISEEPKNEFDAWADILKNNLNLTTNSDLLEDNLKNLQSTGTRLDTLATQKTEGEVKRQVKVNNVKMNFDSGFCMGKSKIKNSKAAQQKKLGPTRINQILPERGQSRTFRINQNLKSKSSKNVQSQFNQTLYGSKTQLNHVTPLKPKDQTTLKNDLFISQTANFKQRIDEASGQTRITNTSRTQLTQDYLQLETIPDTTKVLSYTGAIKKGANFEMHNPEFQKRKKILTRLESIPETDFLVRGVNQHSQIQQNHNFSVFENFRKYNHELIDRAKIALVEVLTPECMSQMAYMDPFCLDELKSKLQTRLSSFIKAELYLHGDIMKIDGHLASNRNDQRYMPDKTFIMDDFKFNIKDLKFDIKKIVQMGRKE